MGGGPGAGVECPSGPQVFVVLSINMIIHSKAESLLNSSHNRDSALE